MHKIFVLQLGTIIFSYSRQRENSQQHNLETIETSLKLSTEDKGVPCCVQTRLIQTIRPSRWQSRLWEERANQVGNQGRCS